MTFLFLRDSKGNDVRAIREALAKALGAEAKAYSKLATGNTFDATVEAAVRHWQSGVGLVADGIIGPLNLQALGIRSFKPLSQDLSLSAVEPLFPATKPANINRYLPYVAASLQAWNLSERDLELAALGTIRAETEGFLPISEYQSPYNTVPNQNPFGRYDNILGNRGIGEGALFRGRGFVQLTGRDNYTAFGKVLGVDLVAKPDLANAPEIAAALLAAFLDSKLGKLRSALKQNDLKAARKLVNGGSHGLDRFSSVFDLAAKHWVAPIAAAAKKRGLSAKMPVLAPTKMRPLKAKKDSIDIRDRLFVPQPVSLLAEYPVSSDIKKLLPRYTEAGLILDQGQEGACTGFGLASVINYLRWRKLEMPAKFASVSPRMLYNFARRYDEYAGENYEGSSCRGAIKGWFNHGVCMSEDWPYSSTKHVQPTFGYAEKAANNTLGVYYRIDVGAITDVQAALQAVGAVYVSACTHDGWDRVPTTKTAPTGHKDLPVIEFDGRPMQGGGHSFALVGFNCTGFVFQNSWGRSWGAGGFAVITYEDWAANAMDAWVVALGVPGVVAGRSSRSVTSADRRAGSSVDKSRWWSEGQAYEHSIVLGNDGRIDRYLTEDERTRTLVNQATIRPDQWFRRNSSGNKKRLVIYAHGGLNSEADAITRTRAMGRYFLGNGCYPLFLVWKTGAMESIQNIFSDLHRKQPAGAGFGNWLVEKNDQLIEATIGRLAARPIWSEMKENAKLAFGDNRGGALLVKALAQLADTWGDQLEIHLVGHSAGSIILGHLVTCIAQQAQARSKQVHDWISSVHLYAPACTVEFANQHYASQPDLLKRTRISLLSDENELNDNTAAIYRKSLLYLVSNALEADKRTPILGLEKVFNPPKDGDEWDGSSFTTETLRVWHRAVDETNLRKRLNVVRKDKMVVALPDQMISAAHGAFDNDVEIISTTLADISQAPLTTPVDDLRGF